MIAGDSGGAPETVTPEAGIVVPGKDLPALIDALDRLLGDAALRARMGAQGRAHVTANWTWQIMGARFREILGLS